MQERRTYSFKKNHPNYKSLDALAFLSKNILNMANYIVRQEFINKGNYLNYNKVQKLLQSGADYQAIPAKFSQEWPLYKDKKKGRNILVYTKQGISKLQLVKNQKMLPSKS